MENPFENVADRELRFWKELQRVNKREIVPTGYNLTPEENPTAEFRTLEMLEVGAKANREERIILPREVWLPRVVLWVQAIDLLYKEM